MISKIRTCLVAILAAATVVTSVPVYAADTKVDTNIETVENQPSDSEQIEENQVQNAIEQHLNYLYIESPYVETPATQRIVVSWGDGTENIEEIDLSVEHNGDTQTWTSVKSEDGVFLYEKAYADGEDGIYTITKLTVKTAEMETSYLLSDLGMEAKFGVNETYEGMSELQPIEGQPDAEAATDEEQYDVAVMSIDEDGNVMEESSIEDALEKAEVEEYDSDEDIQTYAEDNARAVDDSRAVNENVVVALDPGHDSTHTGAGANGVREEVLTLKIAQYCKEELEKYANVSVYMTRTTAACPYPSNKNSGGDISDRVYAAAKAGASIFVSFHLNSSTSTSAKGAEVIVPNDSWKPEVAQQGKELANDIMDELTAIGLQKRSIYSKDTTLADEKYPDGSKSDYFSVQIAAKENNIPGIIVEHAFVTNTGDVNTYLNNEAGLKKLGVADATGIAKYLGVSKEKGTWVEDSNGWKYKEGGKYVTNSWKDIDGKRYYFDANGYRVTGWQTIGGKKYFFMPEGYMMTGWISFGQTRYYLMPDGHMLTGWCSFGSTKYYLASDGKMVRGWQTISGKKYFFMPEGYMMTGWISFGKTRYYLDKNGVMQTGWQFISNTWYYFRTNGTLDDSCTTDQLMAISGKTTVTASQIEKYFKAKGATYPAYYAETDAPTLEKFCQIYVEEANAEGINGAIAFTQAMKETAWLKFGGDVKIEQNNFAGLGTTGGGVAGASFTTVREGIRAQIQHLKAYGSKDALKNECVDPRFSLVTRGSAPYVEWLGQKENPNGYGWATSEGYGIDIEKMVKNLQTY